MSTFKLSIDVSTNAGIDGAKVAELLKRLIEVGLADAANTVGDGEGDIDSARLALDLQISEPVLTPEETSVPVKYWDCYSDADTVSTHQIDIADQRASNGQVFITVGALEGSLDDMIPATIEVNTNPLNGIDHVPCVHVHFDLDSVAASLFKVGDKILVRPETDVTITPFSHRVNGHVATLYWIE